MNIMRDAGVAAVMLLVAGGADTQQKAPAPPPKAAKLIAQWGKGTVADYCAGGSLRAKGPAAKIVFRVDLNRDGFTDYVITRGFDCYMDGEVFHSAFSPSAPWALVESTSIDNGVVGAEGSNWQITPFSNSDEVDEPALREVDGVQALILVDARPGMNNPPYYSYAWTGVPGHAIAWFDRDGKRINKDGSPLGVAKVAPVGPLGISPGYYVREQEDCRSGNAFFFYDGKRVGQYHDRPAKSDIQPVAKLKKSGKNWVQVVDGWESTITVFNPTRVDWEDQEFGPMGPFRWCPTEQVPVRATVK